MDGRKILVVDDNQELLRLLVRLLEAEGWQAVACPRGKAALDAVKKEVPSVAIVDVLLPDMMGYDVGAELKKLGVPYIFMTGIFKGGRAASEARIQHGAAGYFEKPFEAKRLLEAVRNLLPPEPPKRVEPLPPARTAEELEVELPVENAEPVPGFDLTGKVEMNEGGGVSAVIRGQSLRAAPVAPRRPLRPTPPPVRGARSDPSDEGELRDNLPELITAFWLTQQTGELTVHRGKVRKTILFEQGRPYFASSNLVADRFGPFLVRVGKLTATQLELCEAAAQKKGLKAGDVLVEMGILKEAEKLYYLGQQVKAVAYSLFAWEEGRYRMDFEDRAGNQPIKVDLQPGNLIWRGVKKLYTAERLVRLLPDGERLVPTQQPAYGLHEVNLETWEARVLTLVDGLRTVRDIITQSKQPEAMVRATLWALVALEILEKRKG